MAGQLQKRPGYILLGELCLEFTHGERWRTLPSIMLCVHVLIRLHMRNCAMSTWMTYRYIHTYIHTYIHRYGNFLV